MENSKHLGGIVLTDGDCALCDYAVHFILKRDKNAYFKFAALQSNLGQQLLQQYQLPKEGFKTVVLLENNRAYLRSTAGLRVVKKLNNAWPLFYLFILVPAFIRNFVYNFIAHNRYRWFGKKQRCKMLTEEERTRFLS